MATNATDAAPTLTLTPPDPVPVVAPQAAAGLVPIAEGTKTKLEERADAFVAELIAQDAASPEFGKRVDQLTALGGKEIAAAAGMSNRFLDRPVRAMDKDSGVGADLAALRRTVEDLDPGKKGVTTGGRKFLGVIPFGNSVKKYFDGYVSAQGHIKSILDRLASGKDELLKDNAAIDVERAKLWDAMGKLEQMIHIARTLDQKLEDAAIDLDHTDPAKAKALRESALFYIRQRTQDLLTQMAVTVQGYLALDLVKKNNVELVKLVLQQITALNTTTANIIDATGAMLKDNTARIHEMAASSTIPLETLQRAFQNIYDTMDSIDTFKLKALDSMKQTIGTLSTEVEKSQGYIARAQGTGPNGSAAPHPALTLDGEA